MSDKKSEDIALFKYGIIAPILNDTGKRQATYFKQMAKKVHEVP